MVAIGIVAEPLVVVALLIGGTWINRDFDPGRRRSKHVRRTSADDYKYSGDIGKPFRAREIEHLVQYDEDLESRSASPSLLVSQEPKWRRRRLGIFDMETSVVTPNTRRFKAYFLSRLLERLPFLVECWYWALIYWVSEAYLI